ncbi:MAG: DNA-deoxyinosine glycosylase, partial [Clostridia bacterium]|nr:DNA-deoxyinosine glycosylase [Clostridia bacterium]
EGAADNSIRDVVPNDLTPILTGSKIEKVFCNGRLAYDLYCRYIGQKTGVSAVCLPSTSPANAAWTLPRLIEAWRAAGIGK